MAGRRHRLATVIVRRIEADSDPEERTLEPEREHAREH